MNGWCMFMCIRENRVKVLVCKGPECHFGSEALKVVIMQKGRDAATTTATKTSSWYKFNMLDKEA